MIKIRREQEPGDEIVTAADIDKMPSLSDSTPFPAKKVDEVLFEHHELIRRHFKAIRDTPRGDPRRRDLMRALASELEIHEYVEDHIFYPAVHPVSEDVPIHIPSTVNWPTFRPRR